MALTFRVAHTPITNTIFSGKPLSEVDVKLFHYSKPMENTVFKTKDENGDITLLEAWRRECLKLNEQYPNIHHWIDTEQPDKDGVYYRGLPGEQWRNEMRVSESFTDTKLSLPNTSLDTLYLQMAGRSVRPTEPFAIKTPEVGETISDKWVQAIRMLAESKTINSLTIEAVQELFVEALVAEDPKIRGCGIAMVQTALGKAAERIVVLESLLESERNLHQADRNFALKNETHL